MKATQVHSELQNDVAYNYSRENKDYINMQIVLRAYGYRHTLEHAMLMTDYNPDATRLVDSLVNFTSRPLRALES